MKYTTEQLDCVYNRTSGYCHICHKKLSRRNYAKYSERGAWEVDHSNPRANGGGDHANNYFAACIACNRGKCDSTTAAARRLNGTQRAPLSREKRQTAKFENGLAGAVLGTLCGVVLGPGGAVVGGIIGACVGGGQNPDKR